MNDLLHALGIYSGAANYAAFAASSADPNNERYLDQIRFVSGSALKAR